ncbi:MAG: N-acetylmuramoyl-L-alanine amidase [Verrucomicrobia bacterium]|nr:N-acetylmuramoyl-L-alanine amidase [Verrucomicrobiota bacterium]
MRLRKVISPALVLSLLIVGTATAAVRTITSRGETYVPLNDIAPYYSMELSESGGNVLLKNRWNTLKFEPNGRRCWVNGTLVWLSNPIRKIGWQWAAEEADFNKTVDPSVRPYAFLAKAGAKTIVLDPGHGGNDHGATSPRKVHEKLAVLDIAKRVRNRLQARGIRVEFTRESDRYVSLSDRCKKAASLKADLFVSIHADAASNRSVKGAGTFTLAPAGAYSTHSYGKGTASSSVNPGNKFDLANAALGLRIQQNLVKATGQEDRGVKRARFQVLRDAPCPAALVEVAFLSNAQEEAMVIDASGREKIARGIADGIAAYLNDIERAKR